MAYVIAMVVGALIGAALESGFGALVGAAIAWLLVNVQRQQTQLQQLHEEVMSLKRRSAAPLAEFAPDFSATLPGTEGRTSTPMTPPTPKSPTIDTPLPDTPAMVPPVAPTVMQPAVQPVLQSSAAMRSAAPPHAADTPPPLDLLAPVRRWLTGGNTIAKVGVLILVVGLGLLAKYATEHSHLSPEVRLAGIGVVAIALLGVGWRLRLSRPGYGQVLQGGAVAVLYLTLFVAFRYYGVIAALPALVTMVAVAGLAAALAVLQDAPALAVIGALGGFATPLIVSTGSDNADALFAYDVVLDAGIAAVAWSKTWRALNLIGFFATFSVGAAWGMDRYRPEAFASSEAFLIAFFVLFIVIMLLPARRLAADTPASAATTWVNSSLLFGLPTVVFALQYGLVKDSPYGAALSALVLAAVYVALASWMRRRPQLGITFDGTLAVATVFLTLVVPFALDPRSTAGAWTLEGAGLVWIGFRQGRLLPRAFGYALHLAAAFAMVFGRVRLGAPQGIFNAELFNGLMAAAAAIASAWFVKRSLTGARANVGEATLQPLLIALATLWLIVTAGVEIDSVVAVRFELAATIVAMSVIALLYSFIGGRLRWAAITLPAMAHAPLLLLIAAVDAAASSGPLDDGGIWAWPVAFAVHLVVLRLAAPLWRPAVAGAVHTVGVLAFALLGALVGRTVTAGWGDADSAWPWLRLAGRSGVAPAGTAIAAHGRALAGARGTGGVCAPCQRRPRRRAPALDPARQHRLRRVGRATAAGAAAQPARSRRRPRAGRGAALAAHPGCRVGMAAGPVSRWQASSGSTRSCCAAFTTTVACPTGSKPGSNRSPCRPGVTLLWTSTALVTMWVATRRQARLPWVVGAVLLGAVVLKLLLVDLSGAGTVARIVSFIGVGVLMLVIGYVAPLPTREVRHAI